MTEQDVKRALLAIFHAFKTGDASTLKEFISPDTYWEVPGTSSFAGRYTGVDECIK